MKGPVFAIVAVLTLLSVAASCVLPLLWTRDEVVLREVWFVNPTWGAYVNAYREPALGLAVDGQFTVILVGPALKEPRRPANMGDFNRWIIHGWTPLSREMIPAGATGSRWSLGTGWPMISAVSQGEITPPAPHSAVGSLWPAEKYFIETGPVAHREDRSHDYANAFNQWPDSLYFPGLAINLLVHGLFWYLLVWICFRACRAFRLTNEPEPR